jgi:TolB protein
LVRVLVTAVACSALAAFAARASPPPAPVSIVFLRGERVFFMLADGTQQAPAGLPAYPKWSPRGRYMVYDVTVGNRRFSHLYVADRNGRRLRPRPLARSECFGDVVWSPDETRLAYANYCDVDISAIVVVGRDGRGRRKLVPGRWQINPRWSPDGRTILFARVARPPRGGWYLYVVRPNGRGLRRLPGSSLSPDNNSDWTFSRDGRRVFFLAQGSLNVLNVATGERRVLAPDLRVLRYSLSPDGRLLAIQARPTVTSDAEIYTLGTDGSHLQQLTQNIAEDRAPSWSSDGRRILFSSWDSDNSEIYLMNADGSEQTNLSQHPADDIEPSWVPPRR